MPFINCEINLSRTWSTDFVNYLATGTTKFATADTKFYVSIVTLSAQDNEKLLQQLKSGFKRTINWNKYQPKITIQAQNPYLHFLIDSRKKRNKRLNCYQI